MDHWPDIDRCRKLEAAGFPQKTLFSWKKCFRPEIDDLNGGHTVDLTNINLWKYINVCAAPIVTELEAEIKKLNPPKREDEAWIDIDIMADGTVYAGIPELLEECEYHQADTIPNVLTDLWLWLRGREKS